MSGVRLRMVLHTGIAEERDHDYFERTVNRVARLLAIGHGGQVLLSTATAELATAEHATGVLATAELGTTSKVATALRELAATASKISNSQKRVRADVAR